MMFEDWRAFIAMGGHGLYVWMAYSVAVALLVANLAGLSAERRRTRRRLQRLLQAQSNSGATEGGDASQAP